MLRFRSRTPRWVIVFLDLLINVFALFFAYVIRFDLDSQSELIKEEWLLLKDYLWIFIIVKLIVFYLFKIHKGLVRYTSTHDLNRIFIAVSSCTLIFAGIGLIRYNFIDAFYLIPTSVLIVEFLASFAFTVGSRFIIKLIYLESQKNKDEIENVIVYGAGISGLITKRTIENDTKSSLQIIGFIDDNPKLWGTRMEGKNIYSPKNLIALHKKKNIDTIIIAIQNPKPERRKALLDECITLNIKVQKVPDPKSWINGEFTSKQFVKAKIEDLLGREEIKLNIAKIEANLKGKKILITGAAGSIGSGLVKQIANFEPALLILFDQAESSLYDLQWEIKDETPNVKFEIVIGDVTHRKRVENLIRSFSPEVVFHAAAYKHVPLMELNPSEAVKTNILGSKILIDICDEFKVKKFVFISTDKAVNPTNVMGATKRVAEIYAQEKNLNSDTQFITTRFGNVLGSNGSVIPLFQRQIENGGPITITDNRITRFFMSIPEACQLVLEASVMGNGGEIYVFDMGDSVKIIDLAKKMISLSGMTIDKDIQIKVTGLRPGEKLFEELLANEENTVPTHHKKILIAKTEVKKMKESKINALIDLIDAQKNDELVALIKSIVPEYLSQNSSFEKLDKHG
ncbi:MAG: nucleoside-diphosphate sugar epimerase/dehydratase [Crocinitomicaceae bacterium]|nr:nucleoside-diphosphate sugar epimerase/dehydratase [Crocinitomicaceae bacterium]MDG1735814.1 nucleoside-diphosphate sugar epimerase/dehydratase [Crocinitomicaceae bacterium]MDG2506406.1 nucleoside-diphosphate sugar epimerase/dehydratase [Crocinitomicaceae bacterium]